MKKFCFKPFMLFLLTAATLLCVSCGGDDDEPDDLIRDLRYATTLSDIAVDIYTDGTLYYEFWVEGEAWICGAVEGKTNITIPSQVRLDGKLYKVEFDGGAFERNTSLKSVKIPNTITNIEDKNIFIFGRSIGTSPAIYLASVRKPNALFVISAFTSIRAVADNLVGPLKYLLKERLRRSQL